jgi:hypothetical protein
VRRDQGVGDVFVSGKACRHSGIDEADLQVGMRLAFSLHPDPNGRAPWPPILRYSVDKIIRQIFIRRIAPR